MKKITIELSLTPAELEVLASAVARIRQENQTLAQRAKHQANFYTHCLGQAHLANSVLTKLEAWEANNLVQPHQACPRCGERQIDHLVFDAPGKSIYCTTCHTDYQPREW